MNYHHFTMEERCCLREYYIKGKSYREIARLLGRNVSSVSRNVTELYVFQGYTEILSVYGTKIYFLFYNSSFQYPFVQRSLVIYP